MRAIWLVLVVGCASAKSGDTLVDSVRMYNDGVRWERFAVAANHVPPQERSMFVADADDRAKDLKITDYEVLRVDSVSKGEAKVHIKLSWYNDNEGTLRETQTLQTWEKHGKTWWMVDETKLKGHEMPGLAETAGKDASASAGDAAQQSP